MLDKVAKLLILYEEDVARYFDPEQVLNIPCKEIIPVTTISIQPRKDLDSTRKRHFYFTITDVPGKLRPMYIFCCKTSPEREKWVERITFLSDLATDIDIVQTNADVLRKKLYSATTLLRMNVGEVLLENLLNGTYKKGSRKYKEVIGHLNGYFETWETVMSKKIEVHNELLSSHIDPRKQEHVIEEHVDYDEKTKKQLLLKKVVRTIKHVRKESVEASAAESARNSVESKIY